MKLVKLNQSGIAHWLLPALIIAVVGVIGAKVLSSTHAETPSTASQTQLHPLMVFNGGATAKTNYIYTANVSFVVTNTKVSGSDPVFGENSTKIFYVNEAGDSVFMMNPNGNVVRKVVTPVANEYITGLSWSEVTQKLAMIVTPNTKSGPWTLFTANADGSDLTNINQATGLSSISRAVFSPSGYKMLITANPSAPVLDVINSDGTNLVQIANTTGLSGGSWAPDGFHVTYIGYGNSYADSTLYEGNFNGTDTKVLATSPSPDISWSNPVWSPDSSKITYSTYKASNTTGVSFYNTSDGSTSTIGLLDSCGIEALDWSPSSDAVGLISCQTVTPTNEIYSIAMPNFVPTMIKAVKSSPAIPVDLDWSTQ